MNQNALRRPLAAAVGLGAIMALSVKTSPAQQTAPSPQGPPAPEIYKNIQVLKDMPADQMDISMRFISASVGMQCLGCHVQDAGTGAWAYEKDDKRSKQTSRQHIRIVNTINSQFFNNRPTNTCASCHAGRRSPNSRPPLAELLTSDQMAAMPMQRPTPPAITLDQVLEKYIEALGGRDALEKLRSRVISGTLSDRAGQSFAIAIEEKAPNLYRETRELKPAPFVRGFDGTSGWVQSGAAVEELAGFLLQQALRTADLGLPLRLKEKNQGQTSRLQMSRLDGKETYALTTRLSQEVTETLYFESATGLLLRRSVSTRTPIGQLPEQIDYSDYRAVGGVMMPFEIRHAGWDFVNTLKVADIKPNAPVDDIRFAKPK